MNIETKLKDYRQNKSKIKLLENEERKLLFELGCINENTAFISAVKISDMPKSITNKLVSTVENIVLQREKEIDNKAEVLYQLADISSEKFLYQCEVDETDAWIESLNEEERFIMTMFYIEGHDKNLEYIAYMHNEKFKKGIMNTNSIWRKKKESLNKISELLKCS